MGPSKEADLKTNEKNLGGMKIFKFHKIKVD